MFFTRPLFVHKRRTRFGDRNLPKMDTLPKDKLVGLSKRQLCWTVIIVTIPFIVVYSNILYKRLVLGEDKRRTLREGGMDTSYVMDNIASSRRGTTLNKPNPHDQQPKDNE
ncbi:hypothetical protein COEREDRAFT_78887 [Coemansia reversa NRRL 1564]|uniref:Uncharacterized protein n=1 Tax=Coemansia reversa (strain ATCC 12441 / NRRL 1564) TaxID=763665 RepID=A0A2G5BKL3_COERN|nr:hypothetical protein COEREDRAFT_78887 [Coemansia reversa NRRL 1564]|eukprot:PIA19556.1 hypothetical protein COEREDRAFT_78887 [Coemansia reversa NRRL 1564]